MPICLEDISQCGVRRRVRGWGLQLHIGTESFLKSPLTFNPLEIFTDSFENFQV